MSTQTKIFDTLLKGLKPEDYDVLIEQEMLRHAGYNLHFVIDADLIGNYCFPKGIVEEETSPERRERLTDDYLADEQVTLHSVYTLNKKQDRVILFDEHYPEFKAMLFKAHKYSTSKVNLGFEYFNIKSLSDIEFKDFLYDNFSKIIADVLLKVNGLKKASNLFKEKQIIFEANDFDNEVMKTATQVCRVSKRQSEILAIWTKVIGKHLNPSKKRDAGVVDRILSINSYIQKNGNEEDKKHVFIYLTDSTITKPLFRKLWESDDRFDYPEINGKKVLFIRSIPQTFAYLISLKYHKHDVVDIEGTIENLKELRKTSENVMFVIEHAEKAIGINKKGETFETDIFSNDIFKNYKQLRNVFENTGLLKSFTGLHNSIKSDITDLNLFEIQEIFDRMKREMSTLLENLTTEHSEYLSKLYDEALFSTAFLKGLSLIKYSTTSLNLSKGCDSVEGSYQHLPIFLSFPIESGVYREHMNYLMLLILDRKNEKHLLSSQLSALVKKMEGYPLPMEEQVEMKLLKAFILMIMPSFDGELPSTHIPTNNSSVNDYLAARWLAIIYNSNKLKHKDNPHLYSDLLYMLCWITRRIGEFGESISYANEGINLFPTDPRFYHGRFLACYSKYEELGNKSDNAVADLYSMHEDLIIAQKLYRPFLLENFKGFNSDLMELRLQETFYNSSCYLLTLIANEHHIAKSNEKKINVILGDAREQLTNLKHLGTIVDWMPEYYDTEAWLEYLESFYHEDKVNKIQQAKIAIRKALSLSRSLSLTNKYQKKEDMIINRLNEILR